ncbi:hypothetical protein BJ741DRAFT_644553 [Chytriomyces cf. hyalinus JEL632]|nr:hypothetical protein BJ741DRAFT_644553 [Chytriomyces cf. hyalinus JEL632]
MFNRSVPEKSQASTPTTTTSTSDAVPLRQKPNQCKALFRKTLVQQKRQAVNNIACLLVCPLLLVLTTALLASALAFLTQGGVIVESYLYCSNTPILTAAGLPNYNITEASKQFLTVEVAPTKPFDPHASKWGAFNEDTTPKVTVKLMPVNFFSNGVPEPCVHWFGDAYPSFSQIYERNANLTGLGKIDSTAVPPPDGGWIGQLLKYQETPTEEGMMILQELTRKQLSEWAVVGARPELAKYLGSRAKSNLAVNQLSSLNYSSILSPSFDASSGLLSSIPQRLFANLNANSLIGFTLYPYFNIDPKIQSSNDIDDTLSVHLNQVISEVGKLNKTVYQNYLQGAKYNTDELTSFYASVGAVVSSMPYGGIFLDQFEPEKLKSKWIISYGSDSHIAGAPTFAGTGLRMLSQVSKLNQAQLRAMARGNPALEKATITQGVRAFPEVKSGKPNLKLAAQIGNFLFPFAVSFLLPVFVVMLVKEKEDRVLIMMKMNGMNTWLYYLAHYLTCFVLYACSTLVFACAGYFSKIEMFTLTSPVVFNPQTVITYLLALISVVVSTVLSLLFKGSRQLAVINLWPPFAFYRGLLLANESSSKTPLTTSQLFGDTELRTICLFLLADSILFALLAAYLSQVVPSQFGVQKPWHFPVTCFLKRRVETKSKALDLDPREDDDVRAERARVDAQQHSPTANVVVSHLNKVYPSRKGLGPKIGVRNVTFSEEAGVVLGLLGPNGAGKTTLISILSGLFEGSGGTARIAGFDLKTQTDKVYNHIGICPQFDIHWSDLNVQEHLYFYARLKGIPAELEAAAVDESLKRVSLETLAMRLPTQLSGGEKRRLSIAIALVGNPAVVFLDEPTTGLDPEVRRMIWNIIQDAKEGKTVILTTHSMEEAEALCTRIGIMAKGSMRCLAKPLRLKELYGSGFKLSFISMEEDTVRASEFIESVMPLGWRKMDAFATSTAYEFPSSERAKIPPMFKKIEAEKADHGVLQWSISQTTLEEVFVKIISGDDANAD